MQGLLGDILPGAGLKKKKHSSAKSLINKYAKKPAAKKKAVKKAWPSLKIPQVNKVAKKPVAKKVVKKKAKKARKHLHDKEEPQHHLELGNLMGNLMHAPNEHTKKKKHKVHIPLMLKLKLDAKKEKKKKAAKKKALMHPKGPLTKAQQIQALQDKLK